MKRRAMQIIVLLLLGAIVNVAVAWGCEIGSPKRLTPQPPIPHWVTERVALNDERPEYYTEEFNGLGVFTYRVELKDAVLEQRLPTTIMRWPHARFVCCGLPFLSLDGEAWLHSHGWHHHGKVVYETVAMRRWFDTQVPTRPLWPGFAINTIFYAAILWVVFLAPGTIRRAIRRRRGLCPACAYPIGTSDVCTECGKPLA